MLTNHFQMMKAVITSPKVFFDGVNEAEGYKKSTIFAVINTLVTFILSAVFGLVFRTSNLGIGMVLVGAVFAIPLMIVFFFIGAAILHVIAKILGGQGKLVGTYQSVAYATAIGPATAVPYIGMLFSLYQLYLVVVGLRKAHQYSTTKAVITVLIPVVVVTILVIALVVVAGVALFGFLKSSGMDIKDVQNLQNIKSPEDLQKLYPTFAAPTGETMDYENTYPTGYGDYQDSTNYNPSL